MRDHAALFLGELMPHLTGQCSPRLSLTWRFGFIRAAIVSPFADDDDVQAPADVITMLLGHCSGQLMEELRVERVPPNARRRIEKAIADRRPRTLWNVEIVERPSLA